VVASGTDSDLISDLIVVFNPGKWSLGLRDQTNVPVPDTAWLTLNVDCSAGIRAEQCVYLWRYGYRKKQLYRTHCLPKKLDHQFDLSPRRIFLAYAEWSVGAWQGESTSDNGFISIGLRYVLTTPIYTLKNTWFEVGTGPLAISDLRLDDDKSWGYKLQFDSHLGIVFRFDDSDFSLGYGFHHISNASLGDENHGLNIHMLSLRWRL
jgi:hypothetical protein